jgi:hypothetical protein
VQHAISFLFGAEGGAVTVAASLVWFSLVFVVTSLWQRRKIKAAQRLDASAQVATSPTGRRHSESLSEATLPWSDIVTKEQP